MEEKKKVELELKDIQQVSLDILLDVHQFCLSAGIKYSLAYGSLIGAMRHKGFIPWDDDIDIYMPRPDYDRFCQEYKSEKNILVSPKDSYIAFSRVCDVTKTICDDLMPWTNLKNTGIWIDVFPIDAVEDDQNEFSSKIQTLSYYLDKQIKGRSALCHISSDLPFIRKIKLLIRKIIYSWIPINQMNNKIFNIVNQIPWGTTNHCSQLVCGGNRDKEFFSLDLFDDIEEAVFEGHNLWVASGWKTILQLNYGDYMQLPPEEERVPKQSNYLKFYWK